MSSQLFSWKTSRAAAFCTGCSGSNDENGKPAIREFHYSSRVMTEARARCSFSYCPTRRRMSQTSCFSQSVRRFCMEMVNEQFAADVWWFSVWMFDWAFDWAHALTSILHTWQSALDKRLLCQSTCLWQSKPQYFAEKNCLSPTASCTGSFRVSLAYSRGFVQLVKYLPGKL